ncbi:UDP-glucose--hexose-1-phosphate uridylyltransferase [Clostridium perfringens]|uniref:UDP-glucose--hexose-1-phosphate uridylyltransferase n=1 Tax=Clostridium perfringens TaxID=1502 RepID=UPI0018E3FD0C|nr:UDP-glucose--hexose-1-phosphate uridylyltransferase [Clostridium perfringens]EJT6164454.1 UDP-glucose--hexose-1-phosphate uridylyltransferase [Clostridium perfringens]EJT6655920.1 UDP-glucose--hexose-1-phosphate uridylyltransferase [Clostridium perfringens]MBI6090411.1 UDP-glucose--hexose-1-phosphate uridylyltransferase [Clostridium perfringens]MDK0599812.1 UDP-glucose--hexose-1-phosphate uridylyltransferase [Clostridium perfringens]MDK0602692.1 UDP-glucose--hexose-1-phosphate uridylyltrans
MYNLNALIDRLIEISINNNLIEDMDTVYTRNRLLSLFNENSYAPCEEKLTLSFHETLNELINIAIEKKIIEDALYSKDIFSSDIMNIFLPTPSLINKEFYKRYAISPKESTDYFYSLSKSSNYIRTDRIAKNINFKAPSKYGTMDITINLSKPEKDPKEIALARNSVKSNYPKCLLCIENEGYEGTVTHPDRANHRMIRLDLNDRTWMLQYSPYLYYNEHCIILSEDHVPMKIDISTFKNLLSFVDKFPHYFAGSNADLPIVGGSILSHEHYQGGNHRFPMNDAKKLFDFSIEGFEDVECEAIKWPISTIRLRGENIDSLVLASDLILKKWRDYSDETLDILAYSNSEMHNTITPMVRKEDGKFVVDLSLRNNRTSKEHPLGIFHPHEEVHHIKKENIGLIEVMGLAVLPGRLLKELEKIKEYLRDEISLDNIEEYHRPWALELKKKFDYLKSSTDLNGFVNKELSNKFVSVLEHCGVFKLNEEGLEGFKRFTNSLNS